MFKAPKLSSLAIAYFLMLGIAGCGANNFALVKGDFTRMLTPHPYAVKEQDKAEILNSGMGIVDLNFGNYTETTWKKVEADGSIKSTKYVLTYYNALEDGRRISKLQPGTYFLDGVRMTNDNLVFRSGSALIVTKDDVYGWDVEQEKAKCFSFTLEAGKYLFIPDVVAVMSKTTEGSICPALKFIDPANANSKLYGIGPDSDL